MDYPHDSFDAVASESPAAFALKTSWEAFVRESGVAIEDCVHFLPAHQPYAGTREGLGPSDRSKDPGEEGRTVPRPQLSPLRPPGWARYRKSGGWPWQHHKTEESSSADELGRHCSESVDSVFAV